eukprot:3681968-Rhodomonas_salina.5
MAAQVAVAMSALTTGGMTCMVSSSLPRMIQTRDVSHGSCNHHGGILMQFGPCCWAGPGSCVAWHQVCYHVHQSDRLCRLFASQPAVWALWPGKVALIACSLATCHIGHRAGHGHTHCLLCNLQWALLQGSVACIIQGASG